MRPARRADCIWRRHGVWEVGPDGAPHLLCPDYFVAVNGRRIDFSQDYYRRFANLYAKAIRDTMSSSQGGRNA